MRKVTTAEVTEYMQQAVNELATKLKGYSSIEMTATTLRTPNKISFVAYNSHWGLSGDFDNPTEAIADLVRISKTKKQSELLREQAGCLVAQAEGLEMAGH